MAELSLAPPGPAELPGAGGGLEGAAPQAGQAGGQALPMVSSRADFEAAWIGFQESKGLDSKLPLFNKREIDLYKLFKLVVQQGGPDAVTFAKRWAAVGREFNPPSSMTDLSTQIKKLYTSKLQQFEEAYRAGQLGVQIALDGPMAPPPPKPAAAAAAKAPPKPKLLKAPKPAPVKQEEPQQPTPATRQLRKRAAATPATPAGPPPEAMVGQRVGVLWPEDQRYYFGRLASYREEDATYEMRYDDGDVERLDLEVETWVLEADAPAGSGGPVAAAAGAAAGKETQQAEQAAAASSPTKRARVAGKEAGPGKQVQQVQHAQQAPASLPQQELPPLGLPAGPAAAPPAQPLAAAVSEPLPLPLLPVSGGGGGAAQEDELLPAPEDLIPNDVFAPPTATDPQTAPASLPQLAPPLPHHAHSLAPNALNGFAWGGAGGANGGYGAHGAGALGASGAAGAGGEGPGAGGALPPIPLPPGYQPRRREAAETLEALLSPRQQGGLASLPQPQQPQQLLATEQPHKPQALVAAGEAYRAFTTGSGPPGYEIFCLLPGTSLDQIHVRCWSSGRVLIKTTSAAQPFQQMLQLPGRLNTRSAQALFTAHGHLYVRVDLKAA